VTVAGNRHCGTDVCGAMALTAHVGAWRWYHFFCKLVDTPFCDARAGCRYIWKHAA